MDKKPFGSFSFHRIVIYLLFLIVISLLVLSSLYAKYSVGQSSTSSARTAAFSVIGASESGTSVAVDCSTPPYSSDYAFSITNNSEVAVDYSITVSFRETIPSWITVKLDGVAGVQSGNTAIFANAGSFAPQNSTNHHTLTFQANPLTRAGQYSFSNITVQVDAVQKD